MKEFLFHPRPADVHRLTDKEFIPYLLGVWERDTSETSADFDLQYGCGQLARHLKAPGVEDALISWLRANRSPARWDIAGTFLMGYWVACEQPSETLLAVLLDAAESRSRACPMDSLAQAMGAASAALTSKQLRERVRQLFRSLLAESSQLALRPETQRTVSFVLENVLSEG